MKTDKSVYEFDWDHGNIDKNRKHSVMDSECEEVFFDPRKVSLRDTLHSGAEARYVTLGKTKRARLLYLVYAKRKGKIRIISARGCKKQKEVDLYEKAA